MQPLRGEIIDGTQRFKKNRPLNPGRAARLSLVPGLGHWYAGAPLKGLAFFAAIVGPLVIGTELDMTVVGAALGIPLDLGALGSGPSAPMTPIAPQKTGCDRPPD